MENRIVDAILAARRATCDWLMPNRLAGMIVQFEVTNTTDVVVVR